MPRRIATHVVAAVLCFVKDVPLRARPLALVALPDALFVVALANNRTPRREPW